MFSFLLLLNICLAGEVVESDREVEIIEYVQKPIAFEYVPVTRRGYEKVIYETRVPLVENQKIVFIHPRGPGYTALQDQVKHFLTHWGASCGPGTSGRKASLESHRDNYVSSYAGDMTHLPSFSFLTDILQTKKPHTFIFQYKKQNKVLTEKQWTAILKNIPSTLGCLVLSPLTERDHRINQQNYRTLNRLLGKINSSCQVINVDQEVREKSLTSRSIPVFNSQGQLTDHGRQIWWNEFKHQACLLDPRTYSQVRSISYVSPPVDSID